MTLMSRIRVTAATLAVVLSACGGSAAAPAATAAPTAAPTAAATAAPTAAPTAAAVSIDILAFKFPANTDVAKGATVNWTNKDTAKHTVTSGLRTAKDGKFDSTLDTAGTFSFTFTDAGTFSYYCSFHSSMNATITVK